MSHSSGIPVSEELSAAFGEALIAHTVRFIKVKIVDDQLVPAGSVSTSTSSWEDDLDKVPPELDKTAPCYILFRLDEKNVHGYLWVLMCYVPDKSLVREKMTYASSRGNLRKQLGSTYFSDEVFGTVPGDFSKKGYKAHVDMQKAETPLTWEERQSQQERESVQIAGTSSAYIHGVAFPVLPAATQAIQDLIDGRHNYVQLAIDASAEQIILDHASDIELDSLSKEIPTNDQPRFHFFRYDHIHEGEQLKPIIMIFSCPDGSGGTKSAPVRLRMLYSSSKANIENIVTSLSGKVELKLEVNNSGEVGEEIITNLIHPQKEEEKKNFAKPKGPSKGGKRLIRSEK